MTAHVPVVKVTTTGPSNGFAGWVPACSCDWQAPPLRVRDDADVVAVEHAVGHSVIRGKVVRSGERRG